MSVGLTEQGLPNDQVTAVDTTILYRHHLVTILAYSIRIHWQMASTAIVLYRVHCN